MIHNTLQIKELGIKAISQFYLFVILLYILPFAIFTTRLEIFGEAMDFWLTLTINTILISFILLLHFTINNLSRTGFYLSIPFHTLFILNSMLMIFDQSPILKIAGLNEGVYILRIPLILASILINATIIFYLVYKRRLFH